MAEVSANTPAGREKHGELLVSWNPPAPRAGLAGPGPTSAENWIQVIGVLLVGGLLMTIYFTHTPPDTPQWKAGVAAVLAMDMVGGTVTNALSCAKRWYHRPGQTTLHHMFFVSIHAMQIGVTAYLFADRSLENFAVTYATLLVTAFAVLTVPLYLQRPFALLLVSAVIPAATMLGDFGLRPGVAWFTPLLFLKILVSHLTVEAPFQPWHTRP